MMICFVEHCRTIPSTRVLPLHVLGSSTMPLDLMLSASSDTDVRMIDTEPKGKSFTLLTCLYGSGTTSSYLHAISALFAAGTDINRPKIVAVFLPTRVCYRLRTLSDPRPPFSCAAREKGSGTETARYPWGSGTPGRAGKYVLSLGFLLDW